MDEQQKIMAMMVLAEDQQKAAQTTLDVLAQQVGNIERRATAAVRAEVQATLHSIEQPIVAAFKNHGNAIERAIEAAREATEAIQISVKGVKLETGPGGLPGRIRGLNCLYPKRL